MGTCVWVLFMGLNIPHKAQKGNVLITGVPVADVMATAAVVRGYRYEPMSCFLTKRNIQHTRMTCSCHATVFWLQHSSALMVVTRFRDYCQQSGHS